MGIPVIVISRSDEHPTLTNSILRDSGHPVHCQRVADGKAFEDALAGHKPDLVLYFAEDTGLDLAAAMAITSRIAPPPPLLVVHSRVDEDSIAAAMEYGARDVISLGNRGRFQSVVSRELNAHRLRMALEGVVSSARQYKHELRNLMTGASEAIADVQEGIIIAANPAWAGLFGVANEEDLNGQPFMDLFRESDQVTLKGALVACLRGKWEADSPLRVSTVRGDGSELPLTLTLERVTVEGDPAVRVVVPTERPAERTPEELLEQAVSKDPSTGFYNRHYFLERLGERLARMPAGGIRAMAYIRPDHFARVQADVGVLGTEALLMRMADLLRDLMQPGDLYGRFGGTLFTVLVDRGTMADAQAWAEQVCKAVAAQVFEVDTQSTSLTCTIGLTEVRTSEQTGSDILSEAEAACRKGREKGGNRVILSELSSATERLRQSDALWVSRLRAALMHNRLRLVHQPVVGLHEELHGVLDTRVRMIDEQGEVVLPAEFIPAAERAGMSKNIDRWVIGASFSFCAARQPNLVFVRLSRDSVTDPLLTEWLRARVGSARIRPAQVCFQVSEDLAVQQLKETKALAEQLRRSGFLFAVDHVGAGRDSLQILSHIPMDYVKVDGSLMQGLHRDKDLQTKVGSIAAGAKQLRIRTIAERVESANTMAVLWQLGIAFVQGNFTQSHGVVLAEGPAPGQQASGTSAA